MTKKIDTTVTLHLRDRLKAQLEKTKRGFTKFQKSVKADARKIGVAFAGVTASLGVLGRATIQYGKEIDDLSKAFGQTAEQFQLFAFASKKAGHENIDLSEAFKTLRENASDAAAGTATYAEAFQAIDVQLKDGQGNLRDYNDIFNDTVDALAAYGINSDKAIYFTDLFGDDVKFVQSTLTEGTKSLEQYKKQMESLSLVLSDEVVEQLDRTGGTINLLSNTFKVNGMRIVATMLPTSKSILEFAMSSVSAFGFVGDRLRSLVTGLELFGVNLAHFLTQFFNDDDEIEGRIDRHRSSIQTMQLEVNKLLKLQQAGASAEFVDFGQIDRLRAEMQTTTDQIRVLEGELIDRQNMRDYAFQESINASIADDKESRDQFLQIITDTNLSINEQLLALENLKTDLETQSQKVLDPGGVLEDGCEKNKKAAKCNKETFKDDAKAYAEYANSIVGTTRGAFNESKGLKVAEAITSTALAVTNTLASDSKISGGFAIAQAALVGAMGAAQVAAITSASPGSGSYGGVGSAVTATPQAPEITRTINSNINVFARSTEIGNTVGREVQSTLLRDINDDGGYS